MKAELFICILADSSNAPTLKDCAELTKNANIDYLPDRVEFIVRFFTDVGELIRVLRHRLCDSRESSCIVVSDQLITFDPDGDQPVPSTAAEEIFELVKKSTSACGLIAVTREPVSQVQGIDANVVLDRKGLVDLRRNLEQIVARLWYKKPPANLFQNGGGHLYSFEIIRVADEDQLRSSLELRGRVYESLGYIDQATGQASIEMDAYDRTALHFVVVDRANRNRLAGTMRLIVPSLNCITDANNCEQLDRCAEWCGNIAKKSNERRWRQALEKNSPHALPVLGAFTFFDVPDKTFEIDESMTPKHTCELSRVIVAPEYRGMGISKLLVNHAISIAKDLRRRYLWLECAPHHVKMYEKCGFTVKKHGGESFYKRAQRLDTWAVALFLRLADIRPEAPSANSVCYRLQVPEGGVGNCSLLFQFGNQPATEIKHVFDSPVQESSSRVSKGVRGGNSSAPPLKALIPSALTSRNVDDFIHCLNLLMDRSKVEKLSLTQGSGRIVTFDPGEIKSAKREAIASRLRQWLR